MQKENGLTSVVYFYLLNVSAKSIIFVRTGKWRPFNIYNAATSVTSSVKK